MSDSETRNGLERTEKIDVHHHFWHYNPADYGWIDATMGALRRDFTPADLKPLLASAGLDGAVSVQARQTVEETRWLLDLADQCDFLRGVIGWAPIADDNFLASLEEFIGRRKLKGFRHVIQGEPDEEYILRKDFNRGIRAFQGSGLTYDILIFHKHLPQTIRFVDRHPNQIFVVDHLAKPPIAAGSIEPWANDLRELGRRQNVFCKVSGLVTEADWARRPPGYADLGLLPYLDVAVEAFEPGRLMAGSDWPVCLLGTDYISWFGTLANYFASFSVHEQEAVFGGNAVAVYRL